MNVIIYYRNPENTYIIRQCYLTHIVSYKPVSNLAFEMNTVFGHLVQMTLYNALLAFCVLSIINLFSILFTIESDASLWCKGRIYLQLFLLEEFLIYLHAIQRFHFKILLFKRNTKNPLLQNILHDLAIHQ